MTSHSVHGMTSRSVHGNGITEWMTSHGVGWELERWDGWRTACSCARLPHGSSHQPVQAPTRSPCQPAQVLTTLFSLWRTGLWQRRPQSASAAAPGRSDCRQTSWPAAGGWCSGGSSGSAIREVAKKLGNRMSCQAGQAGSSSGNWRRRRRLLGGSCGARRAVLLLRWEGQGASWEAPSCASELDGSQRRSEPRYKLPDTALPCRCHRAWPGRPPSSRECPPALWLPL